jgi:hypothetical protein
MMMKRRSWILRIWMLDTEFGYPEQSEKLDCISYGLAKHGLSWHCVFFPQQVISEQALPSLYIFAHQ